MATSSKNSNMSKRYTKEFKKQNVDLINMELDLSSLKNVKTDEDENSNKDLMYKTF